MPAPAADLLFARIKTCHMNLGAARRIWSVSPRPNFCHPDQCRLPTGLMVSVPLFWPIEKRPLHAKIQVC